VESSAEEGAFGLTGDRQVVDVALVARQNQHRLLLPCRFVSHLPESGVLGQRDVNALIVHSYENVVDAGAEEAKEPNAVHLGDQA